MLPKKRFQAPAKVVVIENQKGGVGKTTIAYHVACYLAELGYRVLALDLDPQGNLSSRFVKREDRINGYRAVHMFMADRPVFAPLHSAFGVDLVYSLDRDVELGNVERMALGEAMGNFGKNLDPLLDDYDYLVIDTPPAHGNKMTAASVASTHMFVPVELAAFAVTGVESVLETLAEISHLIGRRIQITGLICNRMRKVKAHTLALEEIQKTEDALKVLNTHLSTNGAIDDALRDGVPVWKNKATGAQRESAKMMLNLMKEIAGLVGAKAKRPKPTPQIQRAGVITE